MERTPQIVEFGELENTDEFWADGRLYMKLDTSGAGPMPDNPNYAGYVPGHTGREEPVHPDEVPEECDGQMLIRRDFAPTDKVVVKKPIPPTYTEVENLRHRAKNLEADVDKLATAIQEVRGRLDRADAVDDATKAMETAQEALNQLEHVDWLLEGVADSRL